MKRYIIALLILIGIIMNNWAPHPGPQTVVTQRMEYEVLYGGARGGGKTEVGLALMAEPEYIRNPRYHGLVIRKNADDLSDWTARARIFYRRYGVRVAGKPATFTFPSGAFIKTGHLKDENAYGKYLGHEYQKINVEELTQIPRESDYEMLTSSCRSTIPGLPAQVYASTNPGGAGHVWVKSRFVDVARLETYWYGKRKNLSRIFIPATVDDNPTLEQNDPTYRDRLEAIKDEKLRNAWLYGNWDTFSGQFFDKWSSELHVIKPFRLPPQWSRFRGFDWGYTAHTAVPWIAVDFAGNHYVYREYYDSGKSPSVVSQRVLAMTDRDERIDRTLADPAIWARNMYATGEKSDQQTRKSIYDMLLEGGLFCSMANNDRINGWMAMRELMYWDENIKPRFYVFNNCVNIIRTLPGLVHDDKNVEDVNTLGEDHLGDGIRYVCMHTYHSIRQKPEKSATEKLIDRITGPQSGPDKDWNNF